MAISKLSVINAMLASIGMSALTANDTAHPSYILALAKYDEVDSEFQSDGWWFNRTITTLLQNSEGEVPFALNAVHVDPYDRSKLYVMRNLKLYNLTDATYIIGADVKVRIVYQLPYEETPPVVQHYIKAKARHDFYVDQDGSEPKLTRYARMAAAAWDRVTAEHLKNADVNSLEGYQGIWFRTRYHSNVNRAHARQPT